MATTLVLGRAGYSGYRSAFAAWLRQRGFEVSPFEFRGFDVDHLFSAARATGTDHVVRLVLVPRAANRSWGSWSEKLDAPRRYKTRNNARHLHVAKALGIPAPNRIVERLATENGFAEFAGQLKRSGVQELEGSLLDEEIRTMFRAIYLQAVVVADLRSVRVDEP